MSCNYKVCLDNTLFYFLCEKIVHIYNQTYFEHKCLDFLTWFRECCKFLYAIKLVKQLSVMVFHFIFKLDKFYNINKVVSLIDEINSFVSSFKRQAKYNRLADI